MIKLTPEWIAGFFCGEGYFTQQQTRCKTIQFSLGICMHLRDIDILQVISNTYGGKVAKKGDEYCQWRIGKKADLRRFCKDISPYLVGYKLLQYKEWYKRFSGTYS